MNIKLTHDQIDETVAYAMKELLIGVTTWDYLGDDDETEEVRWAAEVIKEYFDT